MFVCWQNKARIFMVQVCGRVKHHYLERSEVGYLRFFIHKNKKSIGQNVRTQLCRPKHSGGRYLCNSFAKKTMFGCAEYCLCYDCSFIRIHHQDGNYYITKAEATRINA
jgi:hypothetical protein